MKLFSPPPPSSSRLKTTRRRQQNYRILSTGCCCYLLGIDDEIRLVSWRRDLLTLAWRLMTRRFDTDRFLQVGGWRTEISPALRGLLLASRNRCVELINCKHRHVPDVHRGDGINWKAFKIWRDYSGRTGFFSTATTTTTAGKGWTRPHYLKLNRSLRD